MKTAIFAGSFDPITNGHIEILKKGVKIFDKVIIAVAGNSEKKPLLSVEERIELIKACTKNIQNLEIGAFEGLTVEYAKVKNAHFLLRGLRSISDFDYEFQMAQINEDLSESEIETCFIPASTQNMYISSSMVKEICFNNGNISNYVPKEVFEYLKK
ncbi:MAG: pantetheine-phosphate adenylyltransferase [bacterium]|nr:pantetheine-phosphate adenylyltransferase [bacterium]